MNHSLVRQRSLTLVKTKQQATPQVAVLIPALESAPPTATTPWLGLFSISQQNARWLLAFLLALAIHCLPVIWWLIPSTDNGITTPPAAAMVIELAPAPVAPPAEQAMPIGPEQTESTTPPETEPVAEPDIPPTPLAANPEVALKPTPEPEPLPKEPLPLPEEPAPLKEEFVNNTSAPPEAPLDATVAAAPEFGLSSTAVNPNAIPDWQSHLMLKLNEVKRYPSQARRNRQQGVSYLRFTMDREGIVLAKSIEQPSGYTLLDRETLDLIERAQPLPKPPEEMPGETLEFVVPVEFFLRP